MYKLCSAFLDLLINKIGKSLKVHNKENLPESHRYVVTCNHTSYNDVIMLGMALYPNQIHYMAKKELFNNKLFGKFLRSLNAFPVNRENPGPSTLKIPVKLLKENKTVGMFPSGRRTTGEAPLKRGAATIALLSKSPILPAAYVGPTKLLGIITGKAHIKFGQPIDVNELPKSMDRNEKIEYLMNELEQRMKTLQQELESEVRKK